MVKTTMASKNENKERELNNIDDDEILDLIGTLFDSVQLCIFIQNVSRALKCFVEENVENRSFIYSCNDVKVKTKELLEDMICASRDMQEILMDKHSNIYEKLTDEGKKKASKINDED